MQEPASSPSPSPVAVAEPLSPHEHGSNALVSVVQFYASALAAERDSAERLRQQLRTLGTLVSELNKDNDRLRQELSAEKLAVEQARRDYGKLQVANAGVYLRLGELLKALDARFSPHNLKPGAFDDTLFTHVYDAWLALRNERDLVTQLVPERDDPARAPADGP